MFPAYLNSLKLKGKNGNGSFKEQIKQYYIDSANVALKKGLICQSLNF